MTTEAITPDPTDRVRTWTTRVEFWCPGCDERHAIQTGPDGWTWNGDRARPTFTPSVLAHPHETVINPDLEGPALWAPGNVRTTPRCHSFVTDGRIQYLGDSTHELAGQTVDLPVWDAGCDAWAARRRQVPLHRRLGHDEETPDAS